MRYYKTILLLGLIASMPMMAQADMLSDILEGKYNAKTLSTTEQKDLLSDTASGRYRIQKENEQKIFRRSSVADYYVYDTQREERKLLGGGQVRDVKLSPNGRYVAFVKGNNLYLHKLDFGTETAVTTTQDPFIYNGVADWLYEEEFGETCLYAFSPDSKQIAFIRLDERNVPVHYWEDYLKGQYPVKDSLYYTKAGAPNAKASVCVYDIRYKQIREVDLGADTTMYIPRVRWTTPVIEKQKEDDRAGDLLIMMLNRDQTRMTVLSGSAKSTVMRPLYTEDSKNYYIDYELFDQWVWLKDNRIVMLSEKDGWRQIYLASEQGLIQKKLTPQEMDVTAIYGVDETNGVVYYQAAPNPQTRQCYAVSLKGGAPKQLTSGEGIHSLQLSADYKQAIECYQSFTQPNKYTLCQLSASALKPVRVVEDNAEVAKTWKALELNEPQMVEITNANGKKLEAMWLLPKQGTTTDARYPLVIMQYSGPQSQRVLNRWRKRFEYYLASQGYAVLIVDTRGSDCRGRAWRNETYMELGVKEAQDLIAAANFAANQSFIDADRIALLGWSYGGFQTLMTMSQPGHPFRCGIAIAPVTDWKLYDSGYTERFMRRPQVNYGGYKSADLTQRAADLEGQVLIIHGASDDNVHVQNTMVYVEALVQAGKQFEMQIYPDDNHQLRQRSNALHMHKRIMLFLQNNLK